jgi:hypothetical protein
MMVSIQTCSRKTEENIMAFVNDTAFEDDFRTVGHDSTATFDAAATEHSTIEHAGSENLEYAAKSTDDADDLVDDDLDEDEDEDEDDEDEDDDLEDDEDEDDEDDDLDDDLDDDEEEDEDEDE